MTDRLPALIWTVTQVDWSQGERCTTVHTTEEAAAKEMLDILYTRTLNDSEDAYHRNIHEHIGGDDWDAWLEMHEISNVTIQEDWEVVLDEDYATAYGDL